jgi:hypothetical protein
MNMRSLLATLLLWPLMLFGQAGGLVKQPMTTNAFVDRCHWRVIRLYGTPRRKWSNNVAGGWLNEAFYYRLSQGTTNSLKVMTNGLIGIVIGDTNAMNSVYGWPFDGLTYMNFLDGFSGHDYNGWSMESGMQMVMEGT